MRLQQIDRLGLETAHRIQNNFSGWVLCQVTSSPDGFSSIGVFTVFRALATNFPTTPYESIPLSVSANCDDNLRFVPSTKSIEACSIPTVLVSGIGLSTSSPRLPICEYWPKYEAGLDNWLDLRCCQNACTFAQTSNSAKMPNLCMAAARGRSRACGPGILI